MKKPLSRVKKVLAFLKKKKRRKRKKKKSKTKKRESLKNATSQSILFSKVELHMMQKQLRFVPLHSDTGSRPMNDTTGM